MKRKKGDLRFAELLVKIGKKAPILSLFVNEELAFEMIPSAEEMGEYLEEVLK